MPEKKKSVTVNLEWPIDHDGREIASLTFRRMRAGDAFVAEGEENQARAGYLLFAALAGVDLAVIEKIDMEDMERVAEEVTPLMGKSAAEAIEAQKRAREASAGAT